MFLGQSHHYKNSSHRHDLAKLLQNIPKNSSRRHDLAKLLQNIPQITMDLFLFT
jgi:hypothetical protein